MIVNSENPYDHLERIVFDEIHKYKDVLCVDQDLIGDIPHYPYISYVTVNDGIKPRPCNNNFDCMEIPIQLQAVGEVSGDHEVNKKNSIKELGFFLRHIWFKQQPKVDLSNEGIVPYTNVTPTPGGKSPLENSFQFTAGANITFNVYYCVTDNTQPGSLRHTNIHFH